MHQVSKTKKLAKATEQRVSLCYLSVCKRIAIPNCQRAETNIAKLGAPILFQQPVQLAVALLSNLILERLEIGIGIGPVAVDQLLECAAHGKLSYRFPKYGIRIKLTNAIAPMMPAIPSARML